MGMSYIIYELGPSSNLLIPPYRIQQMLLASGEGGGGTLCTTGRIQKLSTFCFRPVTQELGK